MECFYLSEFFGSICFSIRLYRLSSALGRPRGRDYFSANQNKFTSALKKEKILLPESPFWTGAWFDSIRNFDTIFKFLYSGQNFFRIELIKNFQRDVNFKWPTPAPVQKISDRNIFLIRSRCGAWVKITGVGIFWPRNFTSKIFELENAHVKIFYSKFLFLKFSTTAFGRFDPKYTK